MKGTRVIPTPNRLLDRIDDGFAHWADPLLLAGRLLISWYFVSAGIPKISTYAQTAAFMQSHDVPGLLLALLILLEIGGGLLVAVGLLTRITCVALALFTIAADEIFNAPVTSALGDFLFDAEMALVAGFLGLMAVGPGSWSLDALRRRTQRS